MGTPLARKYTVSLIHHIELNKAGWWDKGVQRLIAGTMYLAGRSLALGEILAELEKNFSVHVDASRALPQVKALCANGVLVKLPDDHFKISEQGARELERSCDDSEQTEECAKAVFIDNLKSSCPSLASDDTWKTFNESALLPLIREMGARTYEVITGKAVAFDKGASFKTFLEGFPPEVRPFLRNAAIAFIDPKNSLTRSYILRCMNSYFFVEASNLSEETINALARTGQRVHSFTVFVDTNFLFSLLGLHDNPSNEAALSLQHLIKQVEQRVPVNLLVSPITVDETRGVIKFHQESLGHLRLTPNVASAAVNSESFKGVARKFVDESRTVERPLSAADYFGPYVTGLVTILKTKGVELFNESIDHYSEKQEVIDDIMQQTEFQKRFGSRAKGYEALRHDMLLWHFVKDKRPPQVESPLDAQYWIVTIDFRYLGFDAFKRRRLAHRIPVCVHPTALIQLLQFWIPRSTEFENALLGSLRLPFLFHEFDPAAERVTIRILEVMSRFENIGDLSEETAQKLLVNDALRQKLAVAPENERQIELVREALIEEEKKARDELGSAKKQIADLTTKLVAQELTIQETSASLGTLKAELEERKRRDTEKRVKNEFARKWLAFPLSLIIVLGVAGSLLVPAETKWSFWWTLLVVWSLGLITWLWVLDQRGAKHPVIRNQKGFLVFRRWKKRIFILLGTILTGLIISATWEAIRYYALEGNAVTKPYNGEKDPGPRETSQAVGSENAQRAAGDDLNSEPQAAQPTRSVNRQPPRKQIAGE